MERSVKTIGRATFCKLPAVRQHSLLAELAREGLGGLPYAAFVSRYNELCSWAGLDRYAPPSWLSPHEALEEFRSFHQFFSRHADFQAQEIIQFGKWGDVKELMVNSLHPFAVPLFYQVHLHFTEGVRHFSHNTKQVIIFIETIIKGNRIKHIAKHAKMRQ